MRLCVMLVFVFARVCVCESDGELSVFLKFVLSVLQLLINGTGYTRRNNAVYINKNVCVVFVT